MPRAFSEREKEMIRARLREKGAQLFAERGLKGTSVETLSAAAGISKGAFYLFFDSKEALLMEILEQIELEARTRLLELSLGRSRNGIRQVKELLKSMLVSWERYPVLRRLDRTDYEQLARRLPPERVLAHARGDREFTRELLKRVKKEGIRPKADPGTVSDLLKSLFFVGLHRDELGETEYLKSMDVLIGLVARYIVEGE